MFVFLGIDGLLHDRWLGESLSWAALGALVAVLSAFILFPILDSLRPLLRSYRYPL